MSWSFAPAFLSYCHFPLFHLQSMEYQNDFSGISAPPVALSPWFHRLSTACISGIVLAAIECSIRPVWIRLVLSTNEYPMNLMWSPLIDALNAAPYPSCHSKSRMVVYHCPDLWACSVTLSDAQNRYCPNVHSCPYCGVSI